MTFLRFTDRPPVSENTQHESSTTINDRKCSDLKRNMNSKSSLGYVMFTLLRQLLKRTRDAYPE